MLRKPIIRLLSVFSLFCTCSFAHSSTNENKDYVTLFLSTSMTQPLTRAYLKEGSDYRLNAFYRGINPEDISLMSFMKKYILPLALDKRGGPYAPVSIDPRQFTKYGVTTVPTIVFHDVSEDKAYKVVGTVDISWAKKELEKKHNITLNAKKTKEELQEELVVFNREKQNGLEVVTPSPYSFDFFEYKGGGVNKFTAPK